MSTYSNNLRIELITTGTQAGVWGNTTNTNLGTIIEDSIAGYVTVSVISANQAFTAIDGLADEARNAMIQLTTTTAANFAVYAPPVSKQYIIWNNSAYTATIYNSTVLGNTTAAGSGVAIASGDRVMVFSDGTSFYSIKASSITGTLGIGQGGTGQTTQQGAINALAGAVTSGRYLRGDGTNVTMSTLQAADLPVATNAAYGAIKLGDNTAQTIAANAVTATASRSYALQLNASGQGIINVPWTDSATPPGGATTQVQYNSAGSFAGSSNFVFDGTNVGIGTNSPSSYGKLVVLGSTQPKTAIVTTTTSDSDQALLELRKTNNIGSTANNQVGRISFYSRQGAVDTESAYINVRDNRISGVSTPEIVLDTYIAGTGGGARLKLAKSSELVSYDTFYYSATNGHTFNGAVDFQNAVTVSSVPVVTTTDSQSLTNKTISGASNTLSNIPNSALSNSAITINGSSVSLGGSITVTATNATNISGGAANQIVAQSGASTTTFITAPTVASTYLSWNGSAFTWSNVAPSGSTFPTDISVNSLTVGKGPNNPTGTSTFGYQAGAAATSSAVQQTAIGYRALATNPTTTGVGLDWEGNTAVGYKALEAATTASVVSYNTAVGAGALKSVTTGGANTAVGNGAAAAITTTVGSTAVGTEAAVAATSGPFTAFGYRALYTATTRAAGSVAIGYTALTKATTYSLNSAVYNENNTAVGHLALSNLDAEGSGLAGSTNTALGRSAGSALVSGSNNMMLGSGAQGSTTSISNEITLGNSSITTLRCQVTSITSLSDQRDKYDIEDLPLGLSFVNALRPRRYKWDKRDWYVDEVQKEDGTIETVTVPKDGSRAQTNWNEGFIAQEAKAALQAAGAEWFPLVYDVNPEKLEMSAGKLVPVLVKAIQELTARLEALESK